MFLFLSFLGFMHGLFGVYLNSDEPINGVLSTADSP